MTIVPTGRVAVIGAGVAGLTAAIDLAGRGLDVVVLEAADAPGGKMREVAVGAARLDAGPTVFTLRAVFDALFADHGASLDDHVTLRPAAVLARHAWDPAGQGGRLDLFADLDRSADAIGALAGPAEARGYRDFCARSARIYHTLDAPFMSAPRPTPLSLAGAAGLRGMLGISPFATLWGALGSHFRDPRLRQLFGRYATYSGASPFLAPATLMLIAHVERAGVWLVEGGMHRLAAALAALAQARGARLRYGAPVAAITAGRAGVEAVMLADGERIAVDRVVANADVAALATGLFGPAASAAVGRPDPSARSLSALTWASLARAEGFPLLRHTVFFSAAYQAEFDDILVRRRLPAAPTVYVCAQDRDDQDRDDQDRDDQDRLGAGSERLFCLVNAPPTGDTAPPDRSEIARCEEASFALLARCGLHLDRSATITTTPADFHARFPATGGALYGPAMHGWQAAFRRPGSRTKLPGLYLAGGSVHPGPGVPMAALSGRLAAAALLADLAST